MKSVQNIKLIVPAKELLREALRQESLVADLCIYLDGVDEHQIRQLYQNCFAKSNKHSFCIALKAEDTLIQSVIDQLIPLFNHPRYLIRNERPELLLVQEGSALELSQLEHVQKMVYAQGWQGIHFWMYIPPTSFQDINEGVVSVELQNGNSEQWKELKKYYPTRTLLPEVTFLIKAEKLEDAQAAGKYIEALEEEYEAKHRDLYHLYCRYIGQREEISLLNRHLQHAKAAFENQKVYTEILRSQNETERILNFYHSEYEVLPLWFKRVGHIIKVIMGKRKMHTLFSNPSNVDSF